MARSIKVFQYPHDNLDGIKTSQFSQEIANFVEPGVNMVLLDLKQVTSVTSSGLIPLLAAFKELKKTGCKLGVCSMSEPVRILFELTGLDKVFDSFSNLDEFDNTGVQKKAS